MGSKAVNSLPTGLSWAMLSKLAQYLPQRGMDKAARDVAGALCEYLDDEIRSHRQCQEIGLFPALRARAGSADGRDIDVLLDMLVTEHESLEQSWSGLRLALRDLALARPARLSIDHVERFSRAFSSHVASEDEKLMSLALRILGLADASALRQDCKHEPPEARALISARYVLPGILPGKPGEFR